MLKTHKNTFFISNMPSSVLSLLNLSRVNDFVNKSSSWVFVLTNLISQSLFCTWPLMKWCLVLISLVLEWYIGLLVRLITLVLSQYKGTFTNFTHNPRVDVLAKWFEHNHDQLLCILPQLRRVSHKFASYCIMISSLSQVSDIFHLCFSNPIYILHSQNMKNHNLTLIVHFIYLRIIFIVL